MIRLLILLILLAVLGLAAAWLADHPGTLTLFWFDYRLDTSVAFLLLATGIAAFLIMLIYHVLHRILLAPKHWLQRRDLNHYKQGLSELTHSVASLTASDIAGAEAHTRRAEKMLGTTPLTLLISAQIAKHRGDEATTRALLEQMLNFKETQYLATSSLSDIANKQQQFPQALNLAKEAQALNPRDKTPLLAILSLHLRLGEYQEALTALDRMGKKSQMKRPEINRYRGLIHLAQGQKLLSNKQYESALVCAKLCLREIGDFAPAICFAAECFVATSQAPKALAILYSAMKNAPHPEIEKALEQHIANLPESAQKKWQKRVEKTDGPPDGKWNCNACGHHSAAYQLHCEHCGTFDTVAWQ